MTIRQQLKLPHKFEPRPYQQELFQAFFRNGKKRFMNVWHRRAGKDKTWLNIIIAASQIRVGTYIHTLPKLNQARKVIWEGIDNAGIRFIDHFPSDIIDSVNNSEMAIHFKNGSIYRLGGADHYNSLMGTNPVGILFSEFSLQNPLAWNYLRPIITENKGWAAFVFTPRGKNHAYDAYQAVENNNDWYCDTLGCNETTLNDGSPVITAEMIQAEREAGMTEAFINQEFYCSFETPVEGAYFAEQLNRAERDERICDFYIDTNFPVCTYWDLGVGDSTSIWLIQQKPDKSYDAIAYYENQGHSVQHYINYLKDFRDQRGIVYGDHFAPHDISKRDFNTGKSSIDYARDLGFHFRKVPRIDKKKNAIEMARAIFGRVRFHKNNCLHGINCLKNYHHEYNEKLGVYGDNPVHDWSSHGADAFMTFAQAMKNENKPIGDIMYNRVSAGKIW